jgi:hypothetical protein
MRNWALARSGGSVADMLSSNKIQHNAFMAPNGMYSLPTRCPGSIGGGMTTRLEWGESRKTNCPIVALVEKRTGLEGSESRKTNCPIVALVEEQTGLGGLETCVTLAHRERMETGRAAARRILPARSE